MNTKRLFRIALFTFFAVGLAACNKDDGERWYDSMKDGGPFQTGHWVRFYYIDSEGNDLIDPNDPATLPVSSETRLDVPPAPPTNFDAVAEGYYRYNDHKNDIQYDKVEGLYCFFTFAFGDSRYGDYDFYVYFEGVPDTECPIQVPGQTLGRRQLSLPGANLESERRARLFVGSTHLP